MAAGSPVFHASTEKNDWAVAFRPAGNPTGAWGGRAVPAAAHRQPCAARRLLDRDTPSRRTGAGAARWSNSRNSGHGFPSGIAKKQRLGAEHRLKETVVRAGA